MKKSVVFPALLVILGFGLMACGKSGLKITKPPSQVTTRVLASQSVSSPGSAAGLYIIDGSKDTLARGGISAGRSPGLMAVSPERTTLIAFDSVANQVDVVNTQTEASTGSIQLPGPTTSMVIPVAGTAFVAVPPAPLNGFPIGGVLQLNLTSASTTATFSVPNAQTVVSNGNGTELLVFSNDLDSVTLVNPLLLNTGTSPTVTVPGFDRPVYGFFNGGTTAYILNCGPECGSTSASASVQILDLGTNPPSAGASVPVDGATAGFLSGSTLYVAGVSPTNNSCSGGTIATVCGRLNVVDTGSLSVTGTAVITDGYHDRMDVSANGRVFIGSYGCTNIGDVNDPSGEVRGCLSIYNPSDGSVVIPPDNGDVTGLQSFTSRYVEYVAEGGRLRVYDTTKDLLLVEDHLTNGTITINGQVTDVKAVDFF